MLPEASVTGTSSHELMAPAGMRKAKECVCLRPRSAKPARNSEIKNNEHMYTLCSHDREHC